MPSCAGTACRDLGTAAEAAPSSWAWSRWWPGTQSWSSGRWSRRGRQGPVWRLPKTVHPYLPSLCNRPNGLTRSAPGTLVTGGRTPKPRCRPDLAPSAGSSRVPLASSSSGGPGCPVACGSITPISTSTFKCTSLCPCMLPTELRPL